jgi:hypothetical protein
MTPSTCPFPPYPPQQGLRRFLGMAVQVGGRFGPFLPKGRRGEPLKPVDAVPCNYVSPYSTIGPARFARFQSPHFRSFLPHFGPFVPHAPFRRFAPFYLSIYLFLEREERKEGRGGEKARSTDLKNGQKVYPRIFCVSTLNPWMGDRAAAQCWSGFAGFWTLIHTSTSGNALGSALIGVQEVAHG